MSASSSVWPSVLYWPQLAAENNVTYFGERINPESAAKMITDGRWAELDTVRSFVQRNFLSISVYFETKRVEKIVESEKYPTSGLMSSLGGAISLYLGMSLLAVFELTELALKFAVGCCQRGKNGGGSGNKP